MQYIIKESSIKDILMKANTIVELLEYNVSKSRLDKGWSPVEGRSRSLDISCSEIRGVRYIQVGKACDGGRDIFLSTYIIYATSEHLDALSSSKNIERLLSLHISGNLSVNEDEMKDIKTVVDFDIESIDKDDLVPKSNLSIMIKDKLNELNETLSTIKIKEQSSEAKIFKDNQPRIKAEYEAITKSNTKEETSSFPVFQGVFVAFMTFALCLIMYALV